MKKCRYKRSLKEWLMTLGVGTGLCLSLGWLFYRHILGMLVMLGLLPIWIRMDGERREQRQEQEISAQFQDALQSMVGAMQAGYSLERAVPYAAEELYRLHRKHTPLQRFLQEVSTRIDMSETAEQAFGWLAEATELPVIQEFVQVLVTTKRTGGNLIKVMLHTVEQLTMRREVEREIHTVVAGKRLEAGLMCLLPFGILFYLQLAMPGLLRPLYHNLQGILIMTGILLGYGGSCLWTGKILRVKI